MDQELEPRQMPGRQQFPARFKRWSALHAVFFFFWTCSEGHSSRRALIQKCFPKHALKFLDLETIPLIQLVLFSCYKHKEYQSPGIKVNQLVGSWVKKGREEWRMRGQETYPLYKNSKNNSASQQNSGVSIQRCHWQQKHLWKQNRNDKPVRVRRIFSRPGSLKSKF